MPEEAIKGLESVLTLVGGKVVHASEEFGPLAPPPLPVLPEWSPVSRVPGHYRQAPAAAAASAFHQCAGPCAVHGHGHDKARKSSVPVSDFVGFWGALGCSCWAV